MTENKNSVKKTVFLFVVALLCLLAMTAGIVVNHSMQADAKTLTGEPIRWESENWKVVNFFAPWCAPCLREIPALNRLYRSLEDDVQIIGVSYDGGSQQALQQLVNDLNVEFDVLNTSDDFTLPMVFPGYLPATYLISPSGEVAQTLYGEQTETALRERLHHLRQEVESAHSADDH